ncbi:flap endonuclease GEN homolog 1-like [Tachypleus tridentatus]|uniref:flap endonuclease GEN homolog 1-like n=1 Tax=Tachypleus tridentatus TaxID=6853 RepID=UPI003FD39A1D
MSFKSLQGKTLAVDLSGWVVASQNHTSLEYVKNPHLRWAVLGWLPKINWLVHFDQGQLSASVGGPQQVEWTLSDTGVWIFLKIQRNNARYRGSHKINAQKGNCSHFKAVLKECQDMLESLGIHSIESKGEAEAMCAFLNQCGVVDGCITEDSDFFLYGGLVAYRDFSIDTKLSKVHMYCMTNIETRLKLDRKKLIGLAVLLGCDYLPKGVPGVGKETAVKLMQKFEDVDVIQRFHEWRNDNKFKKLRLPQTAKKLTHCELCNHPGDIKKSFSFLQFTLSVSHPGTEKQHVAKGCIFCGSDLSCHQGTDDQECPCDWHGALKLRSDQGLELSVREKALRVPEFPFPQVSGLPLF